MQVASQSLKNLDTGMHWKYGYGSWRAKKDRKIKKINRLRLISFYEIFSLKSLMSACDWGGGGAVTR